MSNASTLNQKDPREFYLEAFANRHACKEFDPKQKVSQADFDFILETARLSPSSLGLEPWRFLVIQNTELREKLKSVTWGGLRQIPTASYVVVALSRTAEDMRYPSQYIEEKLFQRRNLPEDIEKTMRQRVLEFQRDDAELLGEARYIDDWAAKQTYIALGNMMNAAALVGVDSCPIEGFSSKQLSALLAKEYDIDPKHFKPAYVVTFGYRLKAAGPKLRSDLEELVKWYP